MLQIKEVQQTVAEKTSSLESEAFKTKRLHEELSLVKRKVERLRKIEMATDTNMDQVKLLIHFACLRFQGFKVHFLPFRY